jgi:hypothetical protein
MGYQNACPQTFGARRLAGFLSALPTAWARATQRLRALVGDRRPPVWIPRTYDCRDPRVLHSVRLSRSPVSNTAILYERYSHIVDRAEYEGISHRCMNDDRAGGA